MLDNKWHNKRLNDIWTPDLDDELRMLWHTTHTLSDIAEIMGQTYNTVRARTVKLGLPPRPRGA